MAQSFVDNPFIIPEVMSSIDDIDRCGPDDTIDSVLANITSSHEPVLVYDDETFLGLLNLNKLLYQNRKTPLTLAKNALTQPPFLTRDSSLFDLVTAMLANRLYILPIFDDRKEVAGVVQVSTLAGYLARSDENLQLISNNLEIRDIATAPAESRLRDIYRTLREKRISRIALVDDNRKMAGIVSRKDIRQAWLLPSSRQRFSKNGGNVKTQAFDPQEIPRRDEQPIETYIQRKVYAVSSGQPRTKMVKTLIESPVNSIILTDPENHPVGMVSVRDILKSMASYKPAI